MVSLPLVKLLSTLSPKVCSNSAFMVVKPSVPGDLLPWLTVSGEALSGAPAFGAPCAGVSG